MSNSEGIVPAGIGAGGRGADADRWIEHAIEHVVRGQMNVRPRGDAQSVAREEPRRVIAFKYGTRLQGSLDDGLRWTAFDLSKVKIGPVVEYRQADRLKRTIGFPGMRNAIEAGGFVEIDTSIADFEGRLRHSLTGYDGWSADLAADVGGAVGSRLVLGGEARLSYAGYQFVRREYGPDARDGLEPVDPGNRPYYLTAGGQAQASVHLTRRLDLSGSASLDRLLGALDAPGIRDRMIRQLSTSLSVHFGPRTL